MLAVLLVSLAVALPPGSPPGLPRPASLQAQPTASSQKPGPPPDPQAAGQTLEDAVSIDRIKKELEQPQPVRSLVIVMPEMPTFKVNVYGKQKPYMPDFYAWLEQSIAPKGYSPRARPPLPGVPAGGPPTNQGAGTTPPLASVNLLDVVSSLRSAYREYQAAKARREVIEELQALEAANAQAAKAKEEGADQSAQKKNKKKTDEKKKPPKQQ